MQKNHELTSSVITRANSLPYIHSQMVLPDSVTGIAAEAFMKRNCIESIHMPMHLQRIGLRAFSGCFGLTSVRIPISTVVIELRHDPEHIDPWIINKATTVRCYKGSAVDAYCRRNDFKTEYLED